MKLRVPAVIVLWVLAGCGGGGSGASSVPSTRGITGPPDAAPNLLLNPITLAALQKFGPLRHAPHPPVVDLLHPPAGVRIVRDSTPELNHFDLGHFPKQPPLRRTGATLRSPSNTTGAANSSNGDHEWRGNEATSTNVYGVQVQHSAWQAYPPDGWTIYAPTTKPPNSSCVEASTIYQSSGGQSIAQLGLWDWCPPPNSVTDPTTGNPYPATFYLRKDINQTFINAYTSADINGIPEYTIQIQEDQNDGSWHVWLWNFAQSAWEDEPAGPPSAGAAYQYPSGTDVSGLGARGWDFFEYYGPANSPCASMPTIETTDLMFETGNTYAVATSSNSSYDPATSCFDDSGTAVSPDYTFSTPSAYEWNVVSN